MAEQIAKLTPNRDLQAYFLTPSAIAALSSASSTGFVLSGKWRQQFDWAVVEWNKDNVFEHPSLRYLPDGDLSGLTLTYQEERTGCIPFQSNLFPIVAWDRLRLWVTGSDGIDIIYYVSLAEKAIPVAGSAQSASATMTLKALPGVGQRVGLAFLEEHYYYEPLTADQLSDVAAGIAGNIRNFSSNFTATSKGASVTVTCNGTTGDGSLDGANGNRITMYGFSQNNVTAWQEPAAAFSGGGFPSTYQVTLDFGNLSGTTDANSAPQLIPTTNVRKLRWTWAADLQAGEFVQTEFQVTVSNWSVSGANRLYSVAGPGSRRIEDTDSGVTFSGAWQQGTGNYSGSKAHFTSETGDSCTITYTEAASHHLFLGVRRTAEAPNINIAIDGNTAEHAVLTLPGEDVWVRYPLGSVAAGSHSVTITHAGQNQTLYFDFFEIAYPSNNLPGFTPNTQLALATDWDTYHSQSLPAERTAWLINKLGFTGRINHYVGALWFYEIVRTGTQYATLTVELQLSQTNNSPYVQFALAADQASLATEGTTISHLVLPDDNSSTVALAFAALINVGTNLVWASASGSSLTLTARSMGTLGNEFAFELVSSSPYFAVTPSSNTLSGGIDGTPYDLASDNGGLNDTLTNTADFWRTDLNAVPRINRAARDWHAAYFTAIKSYGMDAVASFSTELLNGDPSASLGIAQRYFDGTPVVLNTPSIQTNFSPTSLAYWQRVYLEMAGLQNAAGLVPYLQFGEVQWWYFPSTNISMPFYDAYTQQQFTTKYGVPMHNIVTNNADPAAYPNEVAFLPTLIGAYTAAIRSALQASYPGCRFEVLYPTDTNDTALNSLINYPSADWTAANLTCLKTESFGFTGSCNLVNCTRSMSTSASKGFPNSQRAHLVGIGDAWSAWLKEADIAQSQGLETVVLFALDQYCLIGYPPPPFVNSTSSLRQG